MPKKPWKFSFWVHKLPPRVSCNHIELTKSILLISCFLLFSVLTNYEMNSNIENDYNQCFIGNHLIDDSVRRKVFQEKLG